MQGFCGGRDHADRVAGGLHQVRGRQLATVIAWISVILSLSSTLGSDPRGFLTDRFPGHWLFWSTSSRVS